MSIFTFYLSAGDDANDMLCASFDPTATADNCLDPTPVSSSGPGHADRLEVPLFIGSTLLASVRDEDGVSTPADWATDRLALGRIIHAGMTEAAASAGVDMNDVAGLQSIVEDMSEWDVQRLERITQYWTETAPADDNLIVATLDEEEESPALSDDDPAAPHPYRVVYSYDQALSVCITPFTTDADLTASAEVMERHHYEKYDMALTGCEAMLDSLRDDVRDEDDTWGDMTAYLLDELRNGNPALRWKSRGAYNAENKHVILIKTGRQGDDWEPAATDEGEVAMSQWKLAGLSYPEAMRQAAANRIEREISRKPLGGTPDWHDYQRLGNEISMLRMQQKAALGSHLQKESGRMQQAANRLCGVLSRNTTLSGQQKRKLASSVVHLLWKEIEHTHNATTEVPAIPQGDSGDVFSMLDDVVVFIDRLYAEDSSDGLDLLNALGRLRLALTTLEEA